MFLRPGAYIIEATTLLVGETGPFTLNVMLDSATAGDSASVGDSEGIGCTQDLGVLTMQTYTSWVPGTAVAIPSITSTGSTHATSVSSWTGMRG